MVKGFMIVKGPQGPGFGPPKIISSLAPLHISGYPFLPIPILFIE